MIDHAVRAKGIGIEQVSGLVFTELDHSYRFNGKLIPGVTSVLERAGLIDYRFLGARRDYYLQRGSAVHSACHFDDEGDLIESSIDPEIMGYVAAWRAFRSDYGFTPVLIEQRVVSERWGFAGTLDRTGILRDGTEIIADIKSGQAPQAVKVQLAAYASCLDHPRTRNRRCIEVHADGTYRVIAFETRDYQTDLNVFLSALTICKSQEVM